MESFARYRIEWSSLASESDPPSHLTRVEAPIWLYSHHCDGDRLDPTPDHVRLLSKMSSMISSRQPTVVFADLNSLDMDSSSIRIGALMDTR